MSLNQSQMARLRESVTSGPKHYVFSVFPLAMRAERPFNGFSAYTLPASRGPKDVTRCDVPSAFQLVPTGDGTWTEIPVFSDAIAEDILHEFSAMVGQEEGYGPGIWTQDSPDPDPEMVEANVQKQAAFFEFLCNQADGLDKQGKQTEITDLHRMAARWLGYNDFKWLEKLRPKALKECVACYSQIDARATICPICTTRQNAPTEVAPSNPVARQVEKRKQQELAELTK